MLSIFFEIVFYLSKINIGAVEQNNLEHNITSEIIDELEDWGQIISSDPAINRAILSSTDVNNTLSSKELDPNIGVDYVKKSKDRRKKKAPKLGGLTP